ncbi:MAG: hypothetical protein EOM55_04250 [Clostridia bacterium]|nr:hypothetical protein [Clostridia bacterium]
MDRDKRKDIVEYCNFNIIQTILESGISNNLLIRRKISVNKKQHLMGKLQRYCIEIEEIEKDETKNFIQKKYLKTKCNNAFDISYIKAELEKFKDIKDSNIPIFIGSELKIVRRQTYGEEIEYEKYDVYYLFDRDEIVCQKVSNTQDHKQLLNEIDLSFIPLVQIRLPKIIEYIENLIEEQNPNTWEEARGLVNKNAGNIIQLFSNKEKTETVKKQIEEEKTQAEQEIDLEM